MNTSRLAGLLARAAHEGTPDNEARTAAVLAVRMMRTAGLIDGAGNLASGGTNPAERERAERAERARAEFEMACAQYASKLRASDREIVALRAELAAAKKAAQAPKSEARKSTFDPTAWRIMPSRFYGKCAICQETVKRGSTIAWSKEGGARHEACHNEAQEKDSRAA